MDSTTDWTSSKFIPPKPWDWTEQYMESIQLLQTEMASIEFGFNRFLEGSIDCPEKECDLDKLMSALLKLKAKVSEQFRFFYVFNIEKENELKNLEDKLRDVLKRKGYGEAQHSFEMKALLVAQILEFVFSAIRKAGKELMKLGKKAEEITSEMLLKNMPGQLGATYKGKLIEAIISETIGLAATTLGVASKGLSKAGAKWAAKKCQKLAEFAKKLKGLAGKSAFNTGVELFLSFGVGMMKEQKESEFKDAMTMYDNSLETFKITIESVQSTLSNVETYLDFLNKQSEKLDAMMNQGQSKYGNLWHTRQVAKQACQFNYETRVSTLNSAFEQDKQSLEEGLTSHEEALKQKEEIFEAFQKECDQLKFKLDLTHDSMKTACIEMFEADSCNRAIQRNDEARNSHEKRECLNPEAPEITELETARETLEIEKDRVQKEIETKQGELNQNISQARQTLETCLDNTKPNCTTSSLNAMLPQNDLFLSLIDSQKNILDSFRATATIVEKLKIKCEIKPMTLTLYPAPESYQYDVWGGQGYHVSGCQIPDKIEVDINPQGIVTCTNCSKPISRITLERWAPETTIDGTGTRHTYVPICASNPYDVISTYKGWSTPQIERKDFTLNATLSGDPLITSENEFSINVSIAGVKREETYCAAYGFGTGAIYLYTKYDYNACNASLYYKIKLSETPDSTGLQNLFSK